MDFNKHYFKESKENFIIPSSIKANYKISGNLSNVSNWKAKIILGNSMSQDKKKGQFDKVGYVAVSLDSNVLVPIARSDEHQAGYEFIENLIRKKLIPDEDYYTIFAVGNKYIYDDNEEDFKRTKTAFQKFLSYGGRNGPVEGAANELRKFAAFMSDVIETPSFKDLKKNILVKGKLAPLGKGIVNSLEIMAKTLKDILKAEDSNRTETEKINQLNSMALDFIDKYKWPIIHSHYKRPINEIEKEILTDNDSYKTVKEIFFGYNGIKNTFHMSLRNANPKNTWSYGDLEQVFGDIKIAKSEFDRISQI